MRINIKHYRRVKKYKKIRLKQLNKELKQFFRLRAKLHKNIKSRRRLLMKKAAKMMNVDLGFYLNNQLQQRIKNGKRKTRGIKND